MDRSGHEALNPDCLPLSLSQREVWLDQCAWPDSTHLNIGGGGFIKGTFDFAAFSDALKDLVAQNESLRLVPDYHGRQRLLASYQPALQVVDLSATARPEEERRRWVEQTISQSFQLGESPPWRFALLRVEDDLHWLSIQFHHLIMDGWGTSQVMRRWVDLYNGRVRSLAPQPVDDPGYLSFIAESLEYRLSSAFYTDGAFWRETLPTLPAALLERRRHQEGNRRIASAISSTLQLSRADYDCLNSRLVDAGSSLFTYIIAVLALYFSRVQNRPELVIGIPSLNRGGKRFKNTLGMFVGVFPLVLQVKPAMTVAGLIAAVNTALRAALRHQRYPLSELGKRLQAIRHRRDSLFDLLFSFERQDYALNFGDTAVSMGARQVFSGLARYPLGITLGEFHPDQDAELTLEASSACFEEAEVACLGRRLAHLMMTMIDAPDVRIDDVDILPPEERIALVSAGMQGSADLPLPQPYFHKFEQQARDNPRATALVWDGGQMDYGTLDDFAERLAGSLRALGAGKDKIVALMLERSPEMVAAVLGVAKAGAAFLPLDIDAPLARLHTLIAGSRASALLIQERNRPRLAALHALTLSIDDPAFSAKPQEHTAPACDVQGGDLAYVLFTSGSTGMPKGVMVEHAALSLRLDWIARAWGVSAADRTGHVTQLTFDPALLEILMPLRCGASVALAPAGRQLPGSLGSFAIRHSVTIMALVPATARGLLDSAGSSSKLRLRVACCGGEVLPPDLAQRFLGETRAILYNVYGPTEATIFATAWRCKSDSADDPVPVGYPVEGTRIYVCDAQGRLLPFGVSGEVCIAGNAIARGYLHQPELDPDAFRPDPFWPGQRMYRTGDQGWLSVDGNLHFQGRLDRQIKLRGYRIEPGEIESAMRSINGVLQAAVKRVEIDGTPLIYAWAAVAEGLRPLALREGLAARLPDYMLPAGISVLHELPVTPTGKIDFDALPAPLPMAGSKASRPPLGRIECALTELWEAALERKHINVHDNFFDIGGDSLAAVEILAGIERQLAQKVSFHQLLENPSIEQLAQSLGQGKVDSELLVVLNHHAGRMPLYLAASGHGDLLRFQELATALGDVCDFYMLQPPRTTAIGSTYQLAGLYAEQIENRGKPGFLAGFSVAGIAALELARILQDRGMTIPGLILIDTVYPGRLLRGAFFWRMLGWTARHLNFLELSMNGRHLGAMISDPGLVAQIEAMASYRPADYAGAVFLLKSTGLSRWDRWLFRPWEKVLRQTVHQIAVPGLHGSIFEKANVERLSHALKDILDDRTPGGLE